MTETEVVEWMQRWVEKRDYHYADTFGDCRVTEVIESSMDIVEFTLEIEDALEVDGHIDLEGLAPKFATLRFSELASEIIKAAAEQS